MRVGVFVGQDLPGAEADAEAVAGDAAALPRVEGSTSWPTVPFDPGPIAVRALRGLLVRIVNAGKSPGYLKPAVTRTLPARPATPRKLGWPLSASTVPGPSTPPSARKPCLVVPSRPVGGA